MPELPVSLSVITFKDKSVIINEMSFLLRGLCSGPCHCFKLDPRGLDFTTGKNSVLLSLCVSFFFYLPSGLLRLYGCRCCQVFWIKGSYKLQKAAHLSLKSTWRGPSIWTALHQSSAYKTYSVKPCLRQRRRDCLHDYHMIHFCAVEQGVDVLLCLWLVCRHQWGLQLFNKSIDRQTTHTSKTNLTFYVFSA